MTPRQVDPELLQRVAEAAAHVAEQTWVHIDAEIKGPIPPLMETLSAEGPYAWMIYPQVRPDGSVKLSVMTTKDEIADIYRMVRKSSDMLSASPLTELRGAWYVFQDSITRTRRTNGEPGSSQALVLLPARKGKGLSGELCWVRTPRAALGARHAQSDEVRNERDLREEVFLLHERYQDALRHADVEGVLDTLNDGVVSAVRDYVNDSGLLISLEGKAAHRAYYAALFDKYEIKSVEPLDRVTQDWYIFAELRITAARRGRGVSGQCSFHTAEFLVPANDGRFIACLGDGTDPV
jgi:hypothetical protein